MPPALAGLLAGFVGGALAPSLLGSGFLRTAAKGAIKVALDLFEHGREQAALLGEATSDLISEAQEERALKANPSAVRSGGNGAARTAAARTAAESQQAHG